MSLTILSRKLDQLNEKQKVLKLTYDVRGTNKHQHRYIKDLKDDFKEDLQLRFGNKPYGLGWNHDSENGSERAEEEGEEAPEIIDDDDDNDEREVQEEPGVMMSPHTVMSNFRPTSGKTTTFAVHERPFSAATTAGRPMTASSVGRGTGGMPQFLFSQRPISAITKINNRNFQSNTQDISESLVISMKGQYQSNQPEELTKMQGSRVNQDMSAQMRASESIFWKNTRKYDNNTRSVKQFQTKQLLFHSPTSDPRLINSSDLTFLTQDKIHNTLEKSKLKEPKNHNFQEVAKSKKINKKERGPDGDASYNGDSQLDAKNSFNQSVSYIHSLRGDAKNSNISGSILSDFESTGKKPRLQRPVTAHPLMSAISPTAAAQKKPLETVAEMVQESNKIYFSSLSDLRKKAFFLKLHSMESEKLENSGLSKELKTVDWTGFKEISSRPDFQSIHLMLIDLNTFDHGKYELEFQANGSLKAKDKEGFREISSVHREFLNSTKTNIAAMTIYFETTTNRLIDVFSRVLVYEEKENEYDLTIWKNIYRFVLHKIILANTPLYPDLKTYAELSKMIKDIIDDRRDYILPIASQVQLLKDHPIVVERNSHVYNFDFHSYIIECSSFYSHYVNGTTQRPTGEVSHRKTDSKSGENLKQRPASAMAPKTKFPMFGTKQSQNAQNVQTAASRKESNHIVDPSMFMSAQNGATSSRKDISLVKKPSLKLASSPEQLIKLDPSRPNSDRKIISLKSDRSHKKPQEKFEMVMQGGRMDIYPDLRAAMGPGRSTTNLRDPSDMMSMTYGGSEYQKFFSASAMQSPNQDRMFQMNPNGITVQYTKSPMKKKSNVVIRMRPQSAMKAPIQAHKSASLIRGLGNAGRGDNPYMFNKF